MADDADANPRSSGHADDTKEDSAVRAGSNKRKGVAGFPAGGNRCQLRGERCDNKNEGFTNGGEMEEEEMEGIPAASATPEKEAAKQQRAAIASDKEDDTTIKKRGIG